MSGKQRDYSTDWSEWIWSDDLGCKYATRYGPTGEVEYDYLRPEETPRYGGEPPTDDGRDGGATSPDMQPGYTTSIPAGQSSSSRVRTTSYKISGQFQRFSTAGPSTSSRAVDDMTRDFQGTSVQDDLPEVQVQGPNGRIGNARHITESSSSFNSNKVLYKQYVEIDEREKKNKHFWKRGRVFMMLWTEPARSQGTHGSHHSTVWLGESVYSEIRRFVVIGEGHGNVICSPIHTYGGRATLKENLPDPQQHAIIYTSSKPPHQRREYDDEGNIVAEERLTKDPIRVVSELDHADGDLGKYSRINYAKIYTVEKYVKIRNIGKVHDDSMESLLASCFFARPVDEPPQGPRKHKSSSSRNDRRDDTSDGRGQSSRFGHQSRRHH